LLIFSVFFFIAPPIFAGESLFTETVTVTAKNHDAFGLDKAADSLAIKKDYKVTIVNFIKTILSVIGVLFLILIIWGGVTWMTAAGNDEKIKKAQKIISGATVGFIIIISAYAVTLYITEEILKTDNQRTVEDICDRNPGLVIDGYQVCPD